jgi:hypothetical protein
VLHPHPCGRNALNHGKPRPVRAVESWPLYIRTYCTGRGFVWLWCCPGRFTSEPTVQEGTSSGYGAEEDTLHPNLLYRKGLRLAMVLSWPLYIRTYCTGRGFVWLWCCPGRFTSEPTVQEGASSGYGAEEDTSRYPDDYCLIGWDSVSSGRSSRAFQTTVPSLSSVFSYGTSVGFYWIIQSHTRKIVLFFRVRK